LLISRSAIYVHINDGIVSQQRGGKGILDRERIIAIVIVIGIFGGLVGGPILSLADYYAPPEKRFWTFIIPEFIGFGCLILMLVWSKSKKKNYPQHKSN
jgi:uncharacterized membrane protein YeaQ/YmgE (transglycosylase-associated protein family)